MKEKLIEGIIEVIKQYNDFENDRGYMYEAAEEILSLLPDISSLIVQEECRICKGKVYIKFDGDIGPCPECQEGKVTRPATLHDVVEVINSMFYVGHYSSINLKFNEPSGGILKKGE